MSTITNQLIYKDILQEALEKQQSKYNIEQLGFLHRSTFKKENNTLKQFMVFVPNYMKKFLAGESKQIFNQVQKHYMSSQRQFQYSDFIVVPYVYSEQSADIVETIYYVLIQCYFKQIPLVILKYAISENCIKSLQYQFQDEMAPDDYGNYVILPDSNYLKEVVFDQQFSQNQNIILTDKQQQHFYPVICDRKNEMEINALHQSQIFLDDPTWIALISDQKARLEGQELHCMNIQKGTYQYGLNFLFVSNLNLMNSKCCLLSCPPGLSHGHTGSNLSAMKLVFKYVGIQNILLALVLDKMHSGGCLQQNNHYYVGYIGCAVGENSNGCGTAMFKLMHSIANQSGANMYLENSKVNNIEFYKKMGLKLYQRYDCVNKFGYKSHVFIMNTNVGEKCQIIGKQGNIDPTNWQEMETVEVLRMK